MPIADRQSSVKASESARRMRMTAAAVAVNVDALMATTCLVGAARPCVM